VENFKSETQQKDLICCNLSKNASAYCWAANFNICKRE